MSLQVDALALGLIGGTFLFQMAIPERRKALLDSFNVSVMSGFILLGLVAFMVEPTVKVTLQLASFYSPHAYAMMIWALGGLLILRGRFPPKHVLLSFAFVYALDEFAWNGLAVMRLWGSWGTTLAYLFTPSWHVFLVGICAVTVVGYLVMRPTFRLNATLPALAAFSVLWAWGAGFPVIEVTNAQYLVWPYTMWALSWEICWQVAFLSWVWASVWPRRMP